jgi:hypothetical protein
MVSSGMVRRVALVTTMKTSNITNVKVLSCEQSVSSMMKKMSVTAVACRMTHGQSQVLSSHVFCVLESLYNHSMLMRQCSDYVWF